MKIFSSLGDWAAAHKKTATLLSIAVIAGICAGGFYGLQQCQYRQSSAYALERLKKCLQDQNTHELALLVDFKSISEDAVRAAKKSFPFLKEKNDPERFISHGIQKALLQKFMEKEHKPQFPEDESETAQLKKPLALLPGDFVSQILKNASVRDIAPDSAELNIKIENPQLREPAQLVLTMERGGQGWIVRHLANADEAAARLRHALLARYAALRNVYLDKNAATTKEMNSLIPIQGCTADAGMLSDRKTFILVVRTVAQNKSNIQINNMNLDTVITGKSGKVLLKRFLNDAQPIEPGERYDHRWSVELDSGSREAQELLNDGPLQCRTRWQTLALNNGKILHIDEIPNSNAACLKPGHDHPASFCEIPLFQH